MAKKPANYEQWLSEIRDSTTIPEIVNAAMQAGRYNADQKAARHDVALVLSEKYRLETQRAVGNPMVIRTIDEKFDKIAETLFQGSKFKAVLNYIIKSEPSFDLKATNISQGKTPPGFVQAQVTYDDKGRQRKPLGYIKPPSGGVDEKGNPEPGLGFLENDGGRGSLGFL